MSFAALARKRAPGRYGYLALPGGSGNYASAPDASALRVTGDIDLRVKVALADWTPGAFCSLLSKYTSGAGTRGYYFWVNTNGTLNFAASSTGASVDLAIGSSVANGITDGTTRWVRTTRDATSGTVKFYTSADGSSWTQLGTDRTTTASTGIYAATAAVNVGAYGGGTTALATGHFYNAQIRSNILDDGSGIVFNADFTDTGRVFTEPADSAAVTVHGTAVASVHP